ncbi:hypothetical protein EDB89DRAFT_747235 [Lactarius sanguifluus]|nr:hypothetical protein EDB89DRAFT_747235 [Lactarius sanguifluus]
MSILYPRWAIRFDALLSVRCKHLLPLSPRGAVVTNPCVGRRYISIMQSAGTQYDSVLFAFYSYGTHSYPDCTCPVVLSNRTDTLIHFGFAITSLRGSRRRPLSLLVLPLRLVHLVPHELREAGYLHQFRLAVPQRNQDESSIPRSKVCPVRSRKCPPHKVISPPSALLIPATESYQYGNADLALSSGPRVGLWDGELRACTTHFCNTGQRLLRVVANADLGRLSYRALPRRMTTFTSR